MIRVLPPATGIGVPVTPRGGGTGNYGQAMPLSRRRRAQPGRDERVKSIAPGRVRGAGRAPCCADIDAATQRAFRPGAAAPPLDPQAPPRIGGFIAGGVGRRRLDQLGRPARSRQCPAPARGDDGGGAARARTDAATTCSKVTHAYGTNGIITESRCRWRRPIDWVDCPGRLRRLHDGGALRRCARLRGRLLKQADHADRGAGAAALFHAAPELFRHRGPMRAAASMVAPHALDAFLAFTRRGKARDRLSAATDGRASTQGAAAGLSSLPGTTRRCGR